VFTATSHRADGLLREVGGNDESANVTGDRGERRVRPGRGRLRVASETEACWNDRQGTGQPAAGERIGETTGQARRLRVSGDLLLSGGRRHATSGCTSVHVWVLCGQRSGG
jgi:hypothetical protein